MIGMLPFLFLSIFRYNNATMTPSRLRATQFDENIHYLSYLAYSTALVSRMTVTRICPG